MLGSLLILVPLSVLLVLALLGLLAWCIESGQFDDLECEGERILEDLPAPGVAQGEAAGLAKSPRA
jgi:cbb3-type cytochrome oxidase maturation protein